MKELQEKIMKANEVIKAITDYFNRNINAFNYMDLKLHDVSYYCYSQFEKDFPMLDSEMDYFNMFCEDQYMFFKEDLSESLGIDFGKMIYQLGRTSSFYLHDRNMIDIERNSIDIKNTISNFMYENYGSSYIESYTLESGLIDVNNDIYLTEEYIEDFEQELDYIINNLYDDVMYYCSDIVMVYDRIKDFKDNQVEIFKEFLELQQEQKEEEMQAEKAREEKALLEIVSVVKKYNIKKEDLQILSSNYQMLKNVN